MSASTSRRAAYPRRPGAFEDRAASIGALFAHRTTTVYVVRDAPSTMGKPDEIAPSVDAERSIGAAGRAGIEAVDAMKTTAEGVAEESTASHHCEYGGVGRCVFELELARLHKREFCAAGSGSWPQLVELRQYKVGLGRQPPSEPAGGECDCSTDARCIGVQLSGLSSYPICKRCRACSP